MVKILVGKLIRLLTRDQEFVRLNYVVSAEPAWLSQVTALVFVYHFLSLSESCTFLLEQSSRTLSGRKFLLL
ncbi:hypothetical protein Peur_048650 [Populus x canadensis]